MSVIAIFRSLLCSITSLLFVLSMTFSLLHAQELSGGFAFEWYVTPESMKKDFGPIVMQQKISDGRYVGVNASASCSECEKYGVGVQLIQGDATKWVLAMSVDDADKFQQGDEQKRFEVAIEMKGRNEAAGKGIVVVNAYALDRIPVEKRPHPEQAIGELIQALPQFNEQNILIYALEGGWRSQILRGLEIRDSAIVAIVDSVCREYFKMSRVDCFDKLLEVTEWLQHQKNHNPLLKKQSPGIAPTEMEIEGARKGLVAIAKENEQRANRPTSFYLVSAHEQHAQLLGMVWMKRSGIAGSNEIHSIFIGDSARNQLDSLVPGLYENLPDMLENAAGNATRSKEDGEMELRRIWPIEE